MNKILSETTKSPFCFSAAKTFKCGCVYLQLKLLTGQFIIYNNSYSCQQFASSFNIMACYLPVLVQYSLQMASTGTAFSYSYIVFSKNCSRFNLRRANFQNFSWGHAFRLPSKLGQHSAKPSTSYH